MRGAALGMLVVALGVALFAWFSGRGSSFSGYSAEQLRTLELAYQQVLAQRPLEPLVAPPKGLQRSLNGGRDAAEQAAISLSMLQDERRRRLLLRGATAAAVLAAVVLTVLLRRGRRAMSAEELRLAAALGTPEAAVAAEQARAAKLLGVSPDAPRQTVEEALAAQLSARDPSRLVGLPLQLQRVAEEQRQALIRARDCLLRIAPESVPSRRGLATAANGQSESS